MLDAFRAGSWGLPGVHGKKLQFYEPLQSPYIPIIYNYIPNGAAYLNPIETWKTWVRAQTSAYFKTGDSDASTTSIAYS